MNGSNNLSCRCIDIPQDQPDPLLDTRAYLADLNGEMGWVFVYDGPETDQVRKIINQ